MNLLRFMIAGTRLSPVFPGLSSVAPGLSPVRMGLRPTD